MMSDNNQSILIKAREFARQCILRERKQVTEEDYFMFVVSKFSYKRGCLCGAW